MIDAIKVEKLKVWYAVFATILANREWDDAKKVEKMRELMDQIDLEVAKAN